MSDEGDCFVVLRADGLYWAGGEWVPDWQDALQWDRHADPGGAAQEVAELLARLKGAACSVAYIPRGKVVSGKLPRRHAKRRVRRK